MALLINLRRSAILLYVENYVIAVTTFGKYIIDLICQDQ